MDSTVVIDIKLDDDSISQRLAAVNREMEELRKSNSEMRKEVKDGTKTWEDVSWKLAENEAKLKSLKAEQSALTGQVAQATKTNRTYGDSLKEQSAQLNELRDRYKSLGKAERESAEGQQLLEHIQKLDEAMKAADASQGQFQRNVGNYPGAIAPLQQQIKELTDALIKMRMEGKQGTEEFQNMVGQVGELQQQLNDAGGSVDNMNVGISALDSSMKTGQMAAGAFNAALSIMALVGVKDSETAKGLGDAQKKLAIAMAAVNGLQVVQNSLSKESALMMGITKLQVWAATKAQDAYTAATGRATVAQRIFNAVANANPYVLLATAILSVVGAIAAFRKGSKEQEVQLKQTNSELKTHLDLVNMLSNSYNVLNGALEDELKQRIEWAKETGATLEDVQKAENEYYEFRRNAVIQRGYDLAADIANYNDYKERYKETTLKIVELEAARNRMKAAGNQEAADFYDAEIAKLQEQLKLDEQRIKAVDQYHKDLNAINLEGKRMSNERNKSIKQTTEAVKQLREQLEIIKMGTVAEAAEAADKENKALADSILKVGSSILKVEENLELLDADKFKEFTANVGTSVAAAPSAFEQLAAKFGRYENEIEDTVGSMTDAFGSLSSIYQGIADDESRSAEEREAAAKKAKQWAKLQIAANAGIAIAKGTAAAMDTPFPANIPALASVLAAVLSAIAQANALAGEGGTSTPTMSIASTGNSGAAVTPTQQQQLTNAVNTGASSSTANLAGMLSNMPAPVLVYSEFTKFANSVNYATDKAKLQ